MVHEPCFLDGAEQTHKRKLFCLSGRWGPTGTPPHTQVLLVCLWGEGGRGGSKLVTSYFTRGNKSIRLEVCNKILGKYGLFWWLSGQESVCQCRAHRRYGFDPWVRKILWRRKWLPGSVFLPEKSREQKGTWPAVVHGAAEDQTGLSS